MGRIRTVKPVLFLDEDLAELPIAARYLFIGVLTLADREGRLEDRPARIAAQLLPYDRGEDVAALVEQLVAAGFLVRYEVDGRACLLVRTFARHQQINHREAKSELPCPPADLVLHMHSRARPGSTGHAGCGREGEGKGRSKTLLATTVSLPLTVSEPHPATPSGEATVTGLVTQEELQAAIPGLPEVSTRTHARPHPHVQPWHIEAVWGVACEARRQFFADRNGAAPQPPKLTPRLRQLITDALKAHDQDVLELDREAFLRQSRALAAGVGIYLDPWCTGKDPRGDGRLYLEPERPWLQQRGKPDPVGRFADLALQRRAALELLLSTQAEPPQETRS